jgi:hypothetical protein
MVMATNGVSMKQLVDYFVDGTEVDFAELLMLGLIQPDGDGYSLTIYGKSFLAQ